MALPQAKETRETGEPDAVEVACPVRRGTGRKGSNDLARGLLYLTDSKEIEQWTAKLAQQYPDIHMRTRIAKSWLLSLFDFIKECCQW